MLRITLFTLFLFPAISGFTQQVLSNSGDHFTNQQVDIAFTLGETITETVSNGAIASTQGFHQPIEVTPVTAINSDPDVTPGIDGGSEILVYPNPFQNEVHIQIGEDKLDHSFFLHDELGRNLNSGILINGETTLDFGKLSSGNYMISILDPLGRRIRSFRIVKH